MSKNREVFLKNNLKEIRQRLQITQDELSSEIGVQKSYYSRLERGDFIPSIKICLMIHQALLKIYFDKTGKHLEKLSIGRLFYLE
jgi:DNA-binding XRE family transcriptional regulator